MQRVSEAAVTVDGVRRSEIGKGLLILLGVAAEDGEAEAKWMAGKVANLRIFTDEKGKMNLSLLDVQGQALTVSQFTLLADAIRGRRPSYTRAACPESAQRLYECFIEYLKKQGCPVECGVFRAEMMVSMVNDGPVTIVIDTPAGETRALADK